SRDDGARGAGTAPPDRARPRRHPLRRARRRARHVHGLAVDRGRRPSAGPVTSETANALVAKARAGDERAFVELTSPHRSRLHAHCYRLLGSVHDADDALQETLLRAWRGIGRFEPRAPVAAWLYRIATNVCLRMLEQRTRVPGALDAHLEPY